MSSIATELAQEHLDRARAAVASIDIALAEARAKSKVLSMEYRTSPSFELQARIRAAKDISIKLLMSKNKLDEDLLAAEYSAQLQFANTQ
jgi:hypothetical protein